MLLNFLRKIIAPTNPLRLAWHRRRALAANKKYGDPSQRLIVIGITGTNGKTTSATLLAHILETAGHCVALATTETFWLAGKKWLNEKKMTTLGAGGLHRFLAEAVAADCTHAVLEISSHALTQSRTAGIAWDAAALTNITPDHFDFHGNFANYQAAKKQLFTQLAASVKPLKLAVLPTDDPAGAEFALVDNIHVTTYGLATGDLRATDLQVTDAGQTGVLRGARFAKATVFSTSLLGTFNILNILTAASLARGLGVPPSKIVTGLRTFAPVAGRLEAINAGQNFRVLVDFAHSPDALEKVLRAAQALTAGKVWVVTGAAGDRTAEIQAEMGAVAARFADTVIVTTDDPYDTDPAEIASNVLSGTKSQQAKAALHDLPDRRTAIAFALQNAKAGDTVVLAGKGAQQFQYFANGRKEPWDDRAVARESLAALPRAPRKRAAWKRLTHLDLETAAAPKGKTRRSKSA